MPLRLSNTLTRRVEPFVPADPSCVTFYTCGPTVYDDAHIGNFRSFLAADLLRRWVESPLCELATDAGDPDNPAKVHKGPRRVVHVMNITDVGHMTDDAEGGERGEDRMAVAGRRLAEAKKAGKLPAGVDVDPADPRAIARYFEGRFKDDARKLGLKVVLEADKDPTLTPRATENVEGMKAVIRRLLERAAPDGRPYAYVAGAAPSRAVYFRVRAFPNYGRLSGNTLERLREGAGGRVSGENQAGKEHPADFLLWKEDPRHIMKWPSPWGEGYPGWHVECTVMSAARLGGPPLRGGSASPLSADDLSRLVIADGLPVIDLHSGGEDNIFPHHECEIAQSCCAFNAEPGAGTFARLWFHPRFLLVDGEKMSKSKGNFYCPSDLYAKGFEPAAVRLALIGTHYRSNANVTMQGLADAQRLVERWRRYHAGSMGMSPGTELPRGSITAQRVFADALNDDLNIAKAVAMVNDWMNRSGDSRNGDADVMNGFDRVLGVLELERPAAAETDIGLFAPGVEPSPEVEARLRARRDARAAKDFKRSDAIRDELAAMGYAIKDMPGGRVEVRRT